MWKTYSPFSLQISRGQININDTSITFVDGHVEVVKATASGRAGTKRLIRESVYKRDVTTASSLGKKYMRAH